eukprot:g22179.t1
MEGACPRGVGRCLWPRPWSGLRPLAAHSEPQRGSSVRRAAPPGGDMSVTISLFDLANLSISHPEPGMVNFLALHSLLHAILKTLGIQHVQTEEPELFQLLDSTGRAPLTSSPSPLQEQPLRPEPRGARSRGPYQQLEEKLRDVEQQVQELRRLPTGMELLESSKKHGKSVHDMWNLLQLRKNTETNKEGVDK